MTQQGSMQDWLKRELIAARGTITRIGDDRIQVGKLLVIVDEGGITVMEGTYKVTFSPVYTVDELAAWLKIEAALVPLVHDPQAALRDIEPFTIAQACQTLRMSRNHVWNALQEFNVQEYPVDKGERRWVLPQRTNN